MPDAPAVNFLAEAVDPDGASWIVQESMPIDSCVDLRNKRAMIPRARTRATEQIRLHEMAHVAHSDNPDHHDSPQASKLCQMLEEYRVDWLLLRDSGITVQNRHDDFDMVDFGKKIPQDTFWRFVYYLQLRFQAAGSNTAIGVKDLFHQMASGLTADMREDLELSIKILTENPTRETRCQEARRLMRWFNKPLPKEPEMRPTDAVIQEIRRQEEEERKNAEYQKQQEAQKKQPAKEMKPEEMSKEERTQRLHEQKKLNSGMGGFPRMGGAQIHDHLARNQKFKQVKAPFTRTGKGIVPEFMENWCIDKRVYRTDHRGGVIVIDTSGSMSPNWALIERQMHEFPNLVVISYGGLNSDVEKKTGCVGRICVHARNGRIDPHFEMELGRSFGNDVDLEALQYGAKFKGPRIWMSDGGVCGGVHGHNTTELRRLCQQVMDKHHYIRVENLEDALNWVNQSKPIHYWTGVGVDADPPAGYTGRRGPYGHYGPRHKFGRRSR